MIEDNKKEKPMLIPFMKLYEKSLYSHMKKDLFFIQE